MTTRQLKITSGVFHGNRVAVWNEVHRTRGKRQAITVYEGKAARASSKGALSAEAPQACPLVPRDHTPPASPLRERACVALGYPSRILSAYSFESFWE